MTNRMSMSRFTAAGVKILERSASEEELNDYITEAARSKSAEPSLEKQLVDLEEGLAKARRETDQLQKGLNRSVAESDELRKRVNGLPQSLVEQLLPLLTEEARKQMLAARQWVMVVGPTTDLTNWTTMAESILRYKLTTIRTADGWALVLGSWTPEVRDPEQVKARYEKPER